MCFTQTNVLSLTDSSVPAPVSASASFLAGSQAIPPSANVLVHDWHQAIGLEPLKTLHIEHEPNWFVCHHLA